MSGEPTLPPGLERLAVADAARRVRSDLGQPHERRPERLPVVAGAGVLFVVIFLLRLAIDDPPALIANFYTVPTALLAVAYGIRGGVAGTAVATGLVFLWHVVAPVEVSALGYASRIAVVGLVGTVAGYYSERLRADIARRRDAERELALRAEDLARSNARLEQAVRRLDALSTIARAAGTETDLRRSLARIAEQGRELAGGAGLAIWVRDGARLVQAAASPAGAGDAATPRSGSGIPLVHRGETLGTLTVNPRDWAPPPDPDLLAAIAASAATAIVTARSIAAERVRDAIAASERERTRWAWELHDQTLQGLVGLRVLLSSALRSGDTDALGRAVGDALSELQVETSNLKHLIAELRPAALDELGLEPALSELCERVAATSGVEIEREFALSGDDLPPNLECTVYRVAQEALTNIGKHAAADHATLAVCRREGTVEVEVTDDGRGFDTGAAHAGFGLRGMAERVELGGGQLEVRSAGRGTQVRATLPVAPGLLPLRSEPDRPVPRPRSPQTTTRSA